MPALDEPLRDGVDIETVKTVKSVGSQYKYGFVTDIEMDFAPKGISEDIVRLISKKNNEPSWMTDWRLTAYRRWIKLKEPDWAMIEHPPIDYQELYYLSLIHI